MVTEYEAIGLTGEPGEIEVAPVGWKPSVWAPVVEPTPTESAGARRIRLAREAREAEEGIPREQVDAARAVAVKIPREEVVIPPKPLVPAVRLPKIDIKTREGYQAYQELPGMEQFGVLTGAGLVPEGAKFVPGLSVDWSLSGLSKAEIAEREASMVALTGRPATGWGYLTAEQVAEQAAAEARRAAQLRAQEVMMKGREERYQEQLAAYEAQQAALAQLAGIPGVLTDEGYSLGAAFAAGKGADVYSALGLGLFTEEQVLGAQLGQVEVSGQARALAELEPYQVTPEISEQLIYEELKRGVPISETRAKLEALPGGYVLPAALKGGVPASTLRLAGFTPEQVKTAEVIAFAPSVIVGKKGEFVGFEAAGEYTREARAPGYVPTVEEYSALHPEMTAGGVVSSYEERYGEVSRSTGLGGITHYPGGVSKWKYVNVPTGLGEEVKREDYPSPPLSIEGFTAQFVAGLDRPVGVGSEWEEAMGTVARGKYQEMYGTGAIVKGIPPSLAAMVTPPGRVFFPEVTIGEITPLEWGIMGAQIATITAPKWVPPLRGLVTRVPGLRRFAPVPKPGLVYPTVTEPYGLPGKPGVTVKVPLPPQNGMGVVSPLAPRFYEIYPGPVYAPYTGAPVPSVGGIRVPSGLISGPGMEIPIGPMGYQGPSFGGFPGAPLVGPIVGLGPAAVAPTTTLPMAPEQIAKLFAPAPTIPVVPSLVIPAPTPGWVPTIIPGLVMPSPLAVPKVIPEVAPLVEPLPEREPKPPIVAPVVIPAVVPTIVPLEPPAEIPKVTPIVEPSPVVVTYPITEPVTIPGLAPVPALLPTIAYEPSVITYPEEYPILEPEPFPEPEPFIPSIIPSIITPPIIPPVEVVPPTEPPPPEEPVLPFPPLLGWPALGAGIARGRRAPRGLFGERGWVFPELVISFPEPFKLERRKVRLAKKRRIPYGKRVLRPGVLSARKMRV